MEKYSFLRDLQNDGKPRHFVVRINSGCTRHVVDEENMTVAALSNRFKLIGRSVSAYNPECQEPVVALFGRFKVDSLRVGQEVLVFGDVEGDLSEWDSGARAIPCGADEFTARFTASNGARSTIRSGSFGRQKRDRLSALNDAVGLETPVKVYVIRCEVHNGDLVGVERMKLRLRNHQLNARAVKAAAMAAASYTGDVMLLDGDRRVIPDGTTGSSYWTRHNRKLILVTSEQYEATFGSQRKRPISCRFSNGDSGNVAQARNGDFVSEPFSFESRVSTGNAPGTSGLNSMPSGIITGGGVAAQPSDCTTLVTLSSAVTNTGGVALPPVQTCVALHSDTASVALLSPSASTPSVHAHDVSVTANYVSAVSRLRKTADQLLSCATEVLNATSENPRSAESSAEERRIAERNSRLYESMHDALSCNVCTNATQLRLWACCKRMACCRACESRMIEDYRSSFDVAQGTPARIRCPLCGTQLRTSTEYIITVMGIALQEAVEIVYDGETPNVQWDETDFPVSFREYDDVPAADEGSDGEILYEDEVVYTT